MPERGLGVKNVVFCGMRARSIAAARVSARPTPGCRGSRRSPHPCRPGPRPRPRRASSATSLRGGAGATSASTTAASVAATAGCSPASAAARGVGLGRSRARSPPRSTMPRAVLGQHPRLEPGRSRRGSRDRRRRRRTRRPAGPAGRRRRGGRARRWIGSMSSSSSTSSTTNIMIAPAPPSVFAGGAQLVAVGARGLEPVVAVGEHQLGAADERRGSRRCGPGRRSRRARARRRRRRRSVPSTRVGLEVVGEAARQAEAPDRVDVGPGRAQQGEPVGLRLRQRCARGAARSCRPARGARARRSRRGCGAACRRRSRNSMR